MYFQVLEKVDGAETLAAKWPIALTYMSGDVTNLETELLIGYDNLAHSIQKALNVERIENKPQLAILEYSQEPNARINYSTDSASDAMPNMDLPFPLYNQTVLHEYDNRQEENRE